MEKIDLVLVGAEGVVENGGIINQVSLFPASIRQINQPEKMRRET